MKASTLQFIMLLIVICSHPIHCLAQTTIVTWPTQDQPAVCGSFGTYEVLLDDKNPRNYTTWHPGIDIPGNRYAEIRAIHTGTVVGVQREGSDRYRSIAIYVRPDNRPCELDVYLHADALPNSSIPALYSGTYGPTFQVICDRNANPTLFSDYSSPPPQCRVNAGQAFARIADYLTESFNSFSHLEYQVLNSGFEPQCPRVRYFEAYQNPLDELGARDPFNVRPSFGPLYIRRYQNETTKPYQSSAEQPALFGNVQILQEITDDMGNVTDAAGAPICPQDRIPDADAWNGDSGSPDRFEGIISSPQYVAFSIKNAYSEETYPLTNIRFTPPIWQNYSTTGNLVYEPSKSAPMHPETGTWAAPTGTGDTVHRLGAIRPPYVQQVTAAVNDEPVYAAHWVEEPLDDQPQLVLRMDDPPQPVEPGVLVALTITTSAAMKGVTVDVAGQTLTLDSDDQTVWTGMFSVPADAVLPLYDLTVNVSRQADLVSFSVKHDTG